MTARLLLLGYGAIGGYVFSAVMDAIETCVLDAIWAVTITTRYILIGKC